MKVSELQHEHAPLPELATAGIEPRTLVLLGAGQTHVQVLAQLARQPLRGVQVVLVAPHARQLCAHRLPAWVAGRAQEQDCAIALEPLVQAAGVRWIAAHVVGLDANARSLTLDRGASLRFDWASINTGLVQNRDTLEQHLPGARAYALYLHPLEGFAALWPRVLSLAQERPLRIAVIGADSAGAELAAALRERLGNCAITLVAPDGVCPQYPAAMRARLEQTLRRQGVTVLHDHALALQEGRVVLGCGAHLACDVPVLTLGLQAPAWLGASSLALDAQGGVAVNAQQQSTSHPQVLAVGGLGQDARDADATRAGAALWHKLQALTQGQALRAHPAPRRGPQWLYAGQGQAIAHWGPWCAQGRWLGWCKQWLDRHQQERCTRA
ncbi:MAG: NAD(P)/FAD-dependent oxidoreductase [Rhodoferax sp.]